MIQPIVGTNSYVSLEAADALASERLFTRTWHTATEERRARAIITATALLDRMQWRGRPLAPTQRLAWPRVANGCPEGYPLTAHIPAPIAAATVELAIHLLSTGELPSGPAIMQRMLGDSMAMYFAHVADELPKHVRRLVEPFLEASSANVAVVRF
ncbi:MAG TPA: DnaT-like ssDNA-binding protein [Sphingomonas sp.]|nr:DnaT-like ssDNA-binding protein [Sphingomonas sp.]